ncbi:MAG: alpha/beta hydrolase [Nitratireductor sp.]
MQQDVAYRSFFFTASDGLRLHARLYPGDGDGLPLICLPGLTRNARDFHALALALKRETGRARTIIAFDYRGRGLSAWDKDWRRYDVLVEAEDIIAGLVAAGIGHGAFVGTSRGGLIIHALAALRPGLLKAAILNDIGPRIDGAGLAQIRAYLERAPRPKTRAEAIAIQRAAAGASFEALSDQDWARMVDALYVEGSEPPVPAYDPALLKTVTGVDLNRPLPELWPQFAGLGAIPVLAIRGANSKLLSAATLSEMADRHPDLETITVAGQGHAPLLETGDLPRRIGAFLAKADRR